MKKPYRSKFIHIANINNSYMNRYKIRYTLGFFKLTIPNRSKLEFFKNKKEEKKLVKYYEYKKVIDELNKNRKNKNPILTIILLTYNHKSTIEKCIKSLLNQETQYDYIIKICDDASTDGTTKICFEYAKKYPEKIEYILQPKNTKCKHFFENVKSVNTKYWCFIDGDDWWLVQDKIEKAISFLENNSEYLTYGTNYYWNKFGKIKDFNKDMIHFSNNNCDVDFNHYIYIHPSARIHKNTIHWQDKEYKDLRKSDITMYLLYLAKGKCYFENTITSIYNITKNGLFQSKSLYEQAYASNIVNFSLSHLLKWKYDSFFEKRVSKTPYCSVLKYFFGKYWGWKISIYFAKQKYIRIELKKIKEKYKKIEDDYYLRKI